MKTSVFYFEPDNQNHFSDSQLSQLRALIGEYLSDFLCRVQVAIGEFKMLSKAWSGPSPAKVRDAIANVEALLAALAESLSSMPHPAEEFLLQAQILERVDTPSVYQMANQISMFRRACTRAKNFEALKGGQGNTSDEAKRLLVLRCWRAYADVLGKAPSTSSRGKFAKLTAIILDAANAKPGVSNDLLKAIKRKAGGVSGNSC